MAVTIFETPVVAPLMRALSRAFLGIAGWRVEGTLDVRARRCVVIAAPHTSNWDMPYTLMGAFALGMHIRFLAKASLFRPPFGALMRWLGGVTVDRERAGNTVAGSVAALKAATGPLQLVLSPEGTRDRVRQWKTGFHHIARGAGLPIQLAFLDYAGRRCGLGPLIDPSDDIDADLARIKAFYAPFRGRHPDQFDAR